MSNESERPIDSPEGMVLQRILCAQGVEDCYIHLHGLFEQWIRELHQTPKSVGVLNRVNSPQLESSDPSEICDIANLIQDATGEFNGGYEQPVIPRALAEYIGAKLAKPEPVADGEIVVDGCRESFENWIRNDDPRAILARHPDRPDEYLWSVMHRLWVQWREIWSVQTMRPVSGEPQDADAKRHLGNLLYMLAGLHPDDQNMAYEEALAFYNVACPHRQVHPENGFVLRLVLQTPLDSATKEQPDELARLRSVLRSHHNWHCNIGEIIFPEDESKTPIDMSGEYGDSSLCSETVDCLSLNPRIATELSGDEQAVYEALLGCMYKGHPFEAHSTTLKRYAKGVAAYLQAPTRESGSEDEAYIIWYEDSQMQPLTFSGYGAKEAAFKKFQMLSQRWNATLFSKVRCNWCTCHAVDRVACDLHSFKTDIEGEYRG